MAGKSKAEERHDEMMGQISIIRTALVGTEDKVGYFERVRNLESWTSSQKKMYWVLGSAIGLDIVTRLAEYLK